MADVEFSLIGLDALLGKLDAVKQDVKRRGGRFALRKAANIIAQKAKEGALQIDDPLTGRSIAQNIAIRFGSRAFRATGDLTFRIGIPRAARPAVYASRVRKQHQRRHQHLYRRVRKSARPRHQACSQASARGLSGTTYFYCGGE